MTKGPTSHRFVSQRLPLHYVDWGNADAPLLLLVHGGKDHCRSWDWVAEALCDEFHVIAPDLRGHGDSAWSPDGDYTMAAMVYDLAQLIHQLNPPTVNIIAHSLGGSIALRYTGLYPAKVRRLVAIEGLGPSPAMIKEFADKPLEQRWHEWIDDKRGAAGRTPRKYATLEEAYQRMKQENGYLSEEQARHLTVQGISQNEDGSYSWKFDNYVRFMHPVDLREPDVSRLWGNITCPTLLMYGADSWASNPERDGRAAAFNNATVVEYEAAAHWLHHDQFARFVADVRDFL